MTLADTGTEGLIEISGFMTIRVTPTGHDYDLAYTLAGGASQTPT